MNAPQRIKIVEPGMETYTGVLGTTVFDNGISVDVVAPVIALHLGCIVRVEGCDTETQVSHAAHLVEHRNDSAPIVVDAPKLAETQLAAAVAAAAVVYTREDLEKVADEKGMPGIRAIAEQRKVKGRSISELIDNILKTQDK